MPKSQIVRIVGGKSSDAALCGWWA
jgi:hypothetical protein